MWYRLRGLDEPTPEDADSVPDSEKLTKGRPSSDRYGSDEEDSQAVLLPVRRVAEELNWLSQGEKAADLIAGEMRSASASPAAAAGGGGGGERESLGTLAASSGNPTPPGASRTGVSSGGRQAAAKGPLKSPPPARANGRRGSVRRPTSAEAPPTAKASG